MKNGMNCRELEFVFIYSRANYYYLSFIIIYLFIIIIINYC